MTCDFKPGDIVIWKHAPHSLMPQRFTIACIAPEHFSNMTQFTDGSLCLTERLVDDYEKEELDTPTHRVIQ